MKKVLALLMIIAMMPVAAVSQSKFAVDPAKYDFSGVFEADSPFNLGILGKEYKRLQIYFESVTRQSSTNYIVKGYSNAAGNVCPFEGTLKIVSITVQDSEDFEADHNVYFLEASYSFKETGGTGTGTFSGKAGFDFWISDNKPLIEDGMFGADGYCNSQYEGFWTSDKTKAKKIANWGSCRIPGSGDLDQGVGEFVPDEKYRSKGWADYFNAIFSQNEEVQVNANFREQSKWWDKKAPVLVYKKAPKPVINVYKKNGQAQGALIQTLSLKVSETPEYWDFNEDGYNEIVQLCDDGKLYVWSPKDGKFYNVPSYDFVKYKGYLTYKQQLKRYFTTHYDNSTQAQYFYMYSYRRGADSSQDAIVYEGSISEKDGIWSEYDKYGQTVHDKVNSPEKLSQIWSDYIRLTMAQY